MFPEQLDHPHPIKNMGNNLLCTVYKIRTGKMVQQVKLPIAKTEDLSSTPIRAHTCVHTVTYTLN